MVPSPSRSAIAEMRSMPSRRIPACAYCHGPAGALGNPLFPRLGGQHLGQPERHVGHRGLREVTGNGRQVSERIDHDPASDRHRREDHDRGHE